MSIATLSSDRQLRSLRVCSRVLHQSEVRVILWKITKRPIDLLSPLFDFCFDFFWLMTVFNTFAALRTRPCRNFVRNFASAEKVYPKYYFTLLPLTYL